MGILTRTTDEPVPARAFTIVGTSSPGDDHINAEGETEQLGYGNQDFFGTRECLRGTVVVVSDGCGSAPDSRTGSAAMVRLALNGCEELLTGEGAIPPPEEFCTRLEAYVLEGIRQAASPLARSTEQLNGVLHDSYLATLWVAVVTPFWTAILGDVGDGFWAVNGDLKVVKAGGENEPDYLTYRLMDAEQFAHVGLRVVKVIPTDELQSLLLGTDGIEPIVHTVEGRFSVQHLWSDSRYRDQTALVQALQPLRRPQVKLVVREKEGGQRAEVSAVRKRGLFSDDATLVVVCRTRAPLPEAWLDYRRTHGAFQLPAPVTVPELVATPAPEPVLVTVGGATAPVMQKASAPALPPAPKPKPTLVSRMASLGGALGRGVWWLVMLLPRLLAAGWKRIRSRRRA